jgi:protein involved in polysaccharide export with SLBB domain
MTSLNAIKVVTLMLVLSACAPAVRNPDPLSAAMKSPFVMAQEYRIQTGDQLDVKFFYSPELNEQVIVRPDGRISMQLANEIMAAGLTPAELTEVLRKKYSVEIGKPEITVIVKSFSNQRIYVDGEVVKPGAVVLINPMTALQAIAQAGGFKETANTSEVILVRRGAGNKIISSLIELDKALDGTDKQQDLFLAPYDIVFVPRTHIANLDIWVDQYLRKMIPIPIGIGVGY